MTRSSKKSSGSGTDNKNIIIALIGAAAIIIAALVGIIPLLNNSTSAPATFQYQVRILSKTTQQAIPNAKVTIEVGGIAPLDDLTDSNGFTRFDIDSSRTGKAGRVIVESSQYQKFVQNIDLVQDKLPQIIQLEPLP